SPRSRSRCSRAARRASSSTCSTPSGTDRMHDVTPARWSRPIARACVVVCTIALLLVLTACTGHSGAATSLALVPQPPGDLTGTEWKLVATDDWHAVQSTRALTLK